jgi:exonuclease III
MWYKYGSLDTPTLVFVERVTRMWYVPHKSRTGGSQPRFLVQVFCKNINKQDQETKRQLAETLSKLGAQCRLAVIMVQEIKGVNLYIGDEFYVHVAPSSETKSGGAAVIHHASLLSSSLQHAIYSTTSVSKKNPIVSSVAVAIRNNRGTTTQVFVSTYWVPNMVEADFREAAKSFCNFVANFLDDHQADNCPIVVQGDFNVGIRNGIMEPRMSYLRNAMMHERNLRLEWAENRKPTHLGYGRNPANSVIDHLFFRGIADDQRRS